MSGEEVQGNVGSRLVALPHADVAGRFTPEIAAGKQYDVKKTWGTNLRQFKLLKAADIPGIVKSLDSVKTVGICDTSHRKIPGFVAVKSEKSGDVYAIMGDRYSPVQDGTVIGPMLKAVSDMGVAIHWRKDDVGTGVTKVHALFGDEQFVIDAGKDASKSKKDSDPTILGLKLYNSYNGKSGFGAEVFGLRMVCTNYNLWGDILGTYHRKHSGSVDMVGTKVTDLIKSMLQRIPHMANIIANASGQVVIKTDAVDLLWALRVPQRNIECITNAPEAYTPEMKGQDNMTMWNLYNAVTAYISYRKSSTENPSLTEFMTKQATRLLTDKTDRLIEQGRELRQVYELRVQNEREERQRKKAMAVAAAPGKKKSAGVHPAARKVA